MSRLLPARVWWPVAPFADESLLGFCVRTMEHNHLPHLLSLLADAGHAYRNRHVDVLRGAVETDALASLLGAPASVIEGMRGREVDGELHHRGLRMRPADLCARVRRFAPGGLAASPHHRAAWCIRTLPVCPDTLEILRSTCSCGHRQSWTMARSITVCEGCGGSLADIPPSHPADADLPALRAYADLHSPHAAVRGGALAALPPTLARLAPEDAIELVLLLAPLMDEQLPVKLYAANRWSDEGGRLAAAVARAWRLLRRWPEGIIDAALGGIEPRSADTRTTGLTRAARILQIPDRELAEPVRAAMAAAAAGLASPGAGDRTAIDFHEAARSTGHTAQSLRVARRAGTLRTAFILRRGEVFPALDRSEIEEIAGTDVVGASVQARRLGVPRYALEQIAGAGLVRHATHPLFEATTTLAVDPGDASELVRSLGERAGPEIPDGVPLSTALAAVGGGEKPYAAVLALLLSGGMRFSMRQGSGRPVRRIEISAEDVRRLPPAIAPWERRTWFDHYLQEDACGILCMHHRDVGRLLPLRREGDRGRTRRFEHEAVMSVAQAFCPRAELEARTRTRFRAFDKLLEYAGAGPPGPFGWPRRDEAERILAAADLRADGGPASRMPVRRERT